MQQWWGGGVIIFKTDEWEQDSYEQKKKIQMELSKY